MSVMISKDARMPRRGLITPMTVCSLKLKAIETSGHAIAIGPRCLPHLHAPRGKIQSISESSTKMTEGKYFLKG